MKDRTNFIIEDTICDAQKLQISNSTYMSQSQQNEQPIPKQLKCKNLQKIMKQTLPLNKKILKIKQLSSRIPLDHSATPLVILSKITHRSLNNYFLA